MTTKDRLTPVGEEPDPPFEPFRNSFFYEKCERKSARKVSMTQHDFNNDADQMPIIDVPRGSLLRQNARPPIIETGKGSSLLSSCESSSCGGVSDENFKSERSRRTK